jgi:hypothetical protein
MKTTQFDNCKKLQTSADRETPAYNERFGAMAALPRGQFSGKLHVIPPQQVQWKPPLRQAAGTLYATSERGCC